MPAWLSDVTEIGVALLLVLLNGFFVAAEFALVKVRVSRIEDLVKEAKPFSQTARWLAVRLEKSLSACQLGITMMSLALGWVGEPAFAHLLEPMLVSIGIESDAALHLISFIIAFTVITALHLVIGEQAPKIFAIRQPERMLLWCAVPLKFFYLATYPLMAGLNATTAWLLRKLGLEQASEHEVPYTEHEIRALLREAHVHGNLTGSEHRLLNAVFEFDDLICRRIMVPRIEVDFIDATTPISESMEMIQRTQHTRYPVCEDSLDNVQGVLHVKDLVGKDLDESFDWKSVMRPPKKVPENMPISKLLRHFQATHQLLAFVMDEYGTMVGIVTLENVLEQIIGDVADEFDTEDPDIVPEGPDVFLVSGSARKEHVERRLGLNLEDIEADTFSGVLMQEVERLVSAGDTIPIPGATAEVIEAVDGRATNVRITLHK